MLHDIEQTLNILCLKPGNRNELMFLIKNKDDFENYYENYHDERPNHEMIGVQKFRQHKIKENQLDWNEFMVRYNMDKKKYP